MIIALQTLIFFRQSLLTVLERLLQPYYKKFALTFTRQSETDDEDEEQVYADFDDEKGVVFYPPMYAQRYAAVSDCLLDERWCGKLEKVVDLGHHDMSFIKYLKEVPGVSCILGVDIESIPLRCSSDLLGCEDYAPKRENPLQVILFQGNAADPDYRLIGCDAVVAIEMIEHMLPQDLDRLVHTVFGFIKPWVAVFTTPNADFNPLFKSLEKNGLRRCDHFFEWTRGQFHDWCSNIVIRYPQFTVACKGVGPGPSGTIAYGCCSQLALFVNKDYTKQQDLNMNSLALVAKVPSPNNMTEMIAGWESPKSVKSVTESNMICDANTDSLARLDEIVYSAKQSSMTIYLTPAFSIETLEYHDKTSQCNIDMEVKRNFLMFNDEDMCFSILVPRRKMDNKVYEIEDVASRLNCTTYHVKRFSKTTQNLMAKNKIDSLVHTREVVDEIRQLTNMLNFKKEDVNYAQNGRFIWYNINWGDDAPYWNQYYKIVREYNYPFETKSDDCRILDLISDEINRLIDIQYDEDFSVDVNKLEIPIDHLMKVVRHITNDVDSVKDLLEWNGYEIMGDVVVHSRLVIDSASVGSCEDDWLEPDNSSDWDTTEVRSTTVSEGSTVVPDYHGRALRRALDKKVRKLRSMLSADEDITTELDRVVCRLMKLALKTSKMRQNPPPTRWMQCKLLDLLTLTEKSIARRKKHYIESFPFNAIGFGGDDVEITKYNGDSTTISIVSKYQKLLKLTESIGQSKKKLQKEYNSIMNLTNDLCDEDFLNNDFLRDFEINDITYAMDMNQLLLPVLKKSVLEIDNQPIDQIPCWLQSDSKKSLMDINSADKATMSPSEHSYSKIPRFKCKRMKKPNSSHKSLDKKTSYSKDEVEDTRKVANRESKMKSKLSKRQINMKSSSSSLTRSFKNKYSDKFGKCDNSGKSKRMIKEHKMLQSSASKPIPASLIELCHPELNTPKNAEDYNHSNKTKATIEPDDYVAATEESLLVDIIMDDCEETIALRRTIGTDANFDLISEHETLINNIVGATKDNFDDEVQVSTEDAHSQAIFIYDINEPSTSKGVRHVGMDVQCGTDVTPSFPMITPVSSASVIPKIFNTGIKIDDSATDMTRKVNEFGTSTNDNHKTFGPICKRLKSPNIFTKGIKIEDSVTNICKLCRGTSTNDKTNQSPERDVQRKYHEIAVGVGDSIHNFASNNSTAICDFKTEPTSPSRKCSLLEKEDKCDSKITNQTSKGKSLKFDPGIKDSIKIIRKNTTCGTSTDFYNESCRILTPSDYNQEKGLKIKFGHSLNYQSNKEEKNIGINKDNDSILNDKHLQKYSSVCSEKFKSNDIEIKDSNINVSKKSECGTATCVLESEMSYSVPAYHSSNIDTQLIKPVSSGLKTEDSGSEFFSSYGSTQCTISSKNNSEYQISQSKDRIVEKRSLVKCVRPKLSCGGVHIHSYREKQESEDIVYQGEWQRQKPKNNSKKIIYNPSVPKKVTDLTIRKRQVISKEKIQIKRIEKPSDGIIRQKVPIQVRQPRLVKVKQAIVVNQTVKQDFIVNRTVKQDVNKIKIPPKRDYRPKIRSNKNISKVASKITVSSLTSKNPNKRVVTLRPTIQTITVEMKGEKQGKKNIKNYIPPYLIRRKNISSKINFNESTDSAKTVVKDTCVTKKKEYKKPDEIQLHIEEVSKGDSITTNLVKFTEEPRDNISYLVFRNEIENSKNPTDCQSESSKNIESQRKKNILNRRSSSPLSQNSSCSTPDSVATVKAVNTRSKVSTRRHSTSSNKSSLINSESDSNTPVRNRKYTKRTKIPKKTDDKDNDKENIAETSKNCTDKKEVTHNVKSAFSGRNNKVFMAQLARENSSAGKSVSKHKPQIPNKSIPKPAVNGKDEKKRPKTATICIKSSLIPNDSANEVKGQEVSECSNLVVFMEPQQDQTNLVQQSILQTPVSQEPILQYDVSITQDTESNFSDLADNFNQEKCSESSVLTDMRKLIEERLGFIDYSYTSCAIKSENLSLNDYVDLDETLSPSIIMSDSEIQETNSNFKSCLDDTLSEDYNLNGISFMSLINSPIASPDLDRHSFNSITAMTKLSEYFLANNEFSNDTPNTTLAPHASSVREIFERKELPVAQKPPGHLAYQAFSGFSMNVEPTAGDQPDYVNLIDSETGSLAMDIARQATSEELFISGRSSGSYESCLIDDDTVVPNWLFNIISQQQQQVVEEEPAQLMLPLPMPIVEPIFDLNGNVVEPVLGVGTGAGDGRGMHSDHSQDSSGRGTSLSSSDTSSGQQSEAILIDPSAFTAQYELIHDPMGSSIGVTTLILPLEPPDSSFRSAEGHEAVLSTSRHPNPLLVTSDIDADVSSLDTDVPDSSDN